LEDTLSAFASTAPLPPPTGKEKKAYKDLHHYLSTNARRPIPLWAVSIAVIASVLAGYFIIPGRTSLPKPDTFQFAELAPDISGVLKLAYTTPLKHPNVQAAAAVFTGKRNEPVARWLPLQNGQDLSSNDRYFIVMRSPQPCYFYVFQIDSTGKLDWLFPANAFTGDSSGQNPVPAEELIKIPPEDRAFYLDENLGIENLYVVTTPGPWPDLEHALSRAAQALPLGKPLLASLDIKARGIAGTEIVDFGSSLQGQLTGVEAQHYFKGIQGALVLDFWFNHVTPQ
jgi:hypothetical protein